MKRFVNGVEVELEADPSIEIETKDGLLFVRGPDGSNTAAAVRSGDAVLVSYRGSQYRLEKGSARARSARAGSGEIHAPMPGRIADVLVKEGDAVKLGQKLLVLEAMKTQQAQVAPFDGMVERVTVQKGAQVEEGMLLVAVKPEAV